MEAELPEDRSVPPRVEAIGAVNLVAHDRARAVCFHRALGFTIHHGGERASLTSLHASPGYLNLIVRPARRSGSWWGQGIFHVSDVDAFYARPSPRAWSPTPVLWTPPGASASSTGPTRTATT